MICAVHQPDFLPYLGFFDKFAHSDMFVLYDTAQYSKGGFHNRNRINTPHGPMWLTVPVHVRYRQSIKQVALADRNFIRSHLRTLEFQYKRAKFFESNFESIERIYKTFALQLLTDFNKQLLFYFFELFGKPVKVVMASDLGLDPGKKANEALLEIAEKVGASTYLSGPGGRDYIDERTFAERGIQVAWRQFQYPVYEQPWREFIPNLSVIDALFNVGPQGLRRFFPP
jgi:hypothetical protein